MRIGSLNIVIIAIDNKGDIGINGIKLIIIAIDGKWYFWSSDVEGIVVAHNVGIGSLPLDGVCTVALGVIHFLEN